MEIIEAVLEAVGALAAFLGAVYAVAVMIPGDQPDKAIKAILDLTLKISKK
jgi:hypothetical protein